MKNLKAWLNSEKRLDLFSFAFAGIIILLFYFLVQDLSQFTAIAKDILNVMMPFIFGFSIAFLLAPLVLYFEQKLFNRIKVKSSTRRKFSVALGISLMLFAFALFFLLVIPQLVSSVSALSQQLPEYIESARGMLEDLILRFNIPQSYIDGFLSSGGDLVEMIMSLGKEWFPQLLNASWQFTKGVFNFLVGIVIATYILLDRERFSLQFKKMNYAFFGQERGDVFLRVSRISSKMFTGFVIGKMIDSLIIGILCFIGMSLLGLQYAILLSVIVGITNMIPVFGPFIGAVPGLFILLIVDPIQALWFALFIFALQQFDGNILGPLILGDSLGLPSLWIMFSIIVGGGFFGIIGMFLGVPIFAVIYLLVREFIHFRIDKQGLDISK
ncbi:MAG: AI-2E family transporter [Erysipelotrichaceae bacterium]